MSIERPILFATFVNVLFMKLILQLAYPIFKFILETIFEKLVTINRWPSIVWHVCSPTVWKAWFDAYSIESSTKGEHKDIESSQIKFSQTIDNTSKKKKMKEYMLSLMEDRVGFLGSGSYPTFNEKLSIYFILVMVVWLWYGILGHGS